MEIKHFKLTNHEEIICEVVEWDSEETRDLVIRKALKIEPKSVEDTNYKYYTFTPWMAMQESLNSLQTLNADQIISMATPSKTALDYFDDVVEEVSEMHAEPEVYEFNELAMDSDETDKIMVH
jgi:hypothetical protein